MKTYRVKVSPEAKENLNRYKNYLRDVKYSSQAAKNVVLRKRRVDGLDGI